MALMLLTLVPHKQHFSNADNKGNAKGMPTPGHPSIGNAKANIQCRL